MNNGTRRELEDAIRHLSDRDERTRQSAIALFRSDPNESLRYLIESLQTNPNFRWKTLCAFRYLDGNLVTALPVVLPHLHDEHRLCRIAAVEIIMQMGTDAKAAVPELIKLLDVKDQEFKALALKGLVKIGLTPTDTAGIAPLGKILGKEICKDKPNREVIGSVSALLRAIGPSSIPTFVSCLRKATRSSMFLDDEYDEWSFEPVFEALQGLLPKSKNAAKQLISLLELTGSPLGFRENVLFALSSVGPTDVDRVVRSFIELGTHIDIACERSHLALFGALFRIGPAAIPTLLRILRCHDDTQSVFAAQVLGTYNNDPYPCEVSEELSQAAKATIPALIAAFQAGGRELKEACVDALGTMAAESKDAVKILIAAVDDPSINGKSGLTQTGGQETALRALESILNDRSRR